MVPSDPTRLCVARFFTPPQVIAKDEAWRSVTSALDNARRDRNAVQQVVAKKKKAKEECDDLVKEIAQVRGIGLSLCRP